MVRLFGCGLALALAAGCHVISPEHIKTAKVSEAESAPEPDPLSEAADCLQRGDDAKAAEYLTRHVEKNPDQCVFRSQLAEILLRLDRPADAGHHLECAVASAQSGSPSAQRHLVHYHTRLMEISRQRGDEYAERLHRAIGLIHVAQQLKKSGKEPEAVERLLFKAIDDLKEAQTLRPEAGRPNWYQFRAWRLLDQPVPAERALQKARAAGPSSDLTPAERRDLTANSH